MRRLFTDIAIIGAGPAGLSAAIEAAKSGADVTLIDENRLPGGQLFKQIHKFFGSKEHLAGTRGFDIGNKLLDQVKELGVNVMLDTVAFGIFPNSKSIGLVSNQKCAELMAKKVILACGAQENCLAFEGSTLPGVMGAGAAQTMINVHRVLPGKKIVMVGSGNVGLIVSYQLMQAGADVVALVEAAPKIGGYGVHASKIMRAGVPILTSHTVVSAYGNESLEGVKIAETDSSFKPVPGTEKDLECDTLCLAVGLNPLTELAWMAGCKFKYIGSLGGHIPLHDQNMKSTCDDIYVSGDICGVEEASSAMEEGRLAGIAAAESLGFIDSKKADEMKKSIWHTLDTLRSGYFGKSRADQKRIILESFNKYAEEVGTCVREY